MHDSLNLYVEKICLEGNVFNYYEKKLPLSKPKFKFQETSFL